LPDNGRIVDRGIKTAGAIVMLLWHSWVLVTQQGTGKMRNVTAEISLPPDSRLIPIVIS
jgi:lysophospholipid acyltransferase (LPLAT)-like uncharacterized protein